MPGQTRNFLTVIGQPAGGEGRAKKYDPAFCDAVKMMAQVGEFPEAWGAEIGVSIETMRAWCHKHAEFRDAIGVARLLLATYWTRELQANRNNPDAKPGLYQMLTRRIPALYGREPVDLGEWIQTPPDTTAPEQAKALDANTVAAATTDTLKERLEALKRRREEEERE